MTQNIDDGRSGANRPAVEHARSGSNDPPAGNDILIAGLEAVGGLAESARRLLTALRSRTGRDDERPVRREQLNYRDAVRFFTDNRDRARGARAGSVVRERVEGHLVVRMVFLDAAGRPMAEAPAAAYSVTRLDPELDAAFGDHDVILVS